MRLDFSSRCGSAPLFLFFFFASFLLLAPPTVTSVRWAGTFQSACCFLDRTFSTCSIFLDGLPTLLVNDFSNCFLGPKVPPPALFYNTHFFFPETSFILRSSKCSGFIAVLCPGRFVTLFRHLTWSPPRILGPLLD